MSQQVSMNIWCCTCECSAMCFNSQFQIPNALTSAAQCSTGAKCIANPGHPDVFGEGAFIASACKKCAPDNSSCLECWEMYGVNKQGECVKVGAIQGPPPPLPPTPTHPHPHR